MNFTISIRVLILSALALALGAATAFWASVVYHNTYQIILEGFDQKLHVLSEGAASLSDGDAHAAYQKPARITAMTLGGDGAWWAYDAARQRLVVLDSGDGGIVDLLPPTDVPELNSLAYDAQRNLLFGLTADHQLLGWQADSWSASSAAPDDSVEATVAQPLDEVISGGEHPFGRIGRRLVPLTDLLPQAESAAAGITLERSVSRMTRDEAGWWAIADDGVTLLRLDDEGKLQQATTLELDGQTVHALLATPDGVYLATDAMLQFDTDQEVAAAIAEPGFYSEAHPFMASHQAAYRKVREDAGLTFLYTEVFFGENQIRYIIDGSVGDDHTTPGYLDEVPETSVEEIVKAQNLGQPFVSDIRQWELWGLIKVSGAPIRDRDGKVVAIAGADVDIGVIRSKTRRALFSVLLVGVGVLLLAGLVSIRIANGLTRPLRRIKDAALRLAAGYFGGQLASGSGDEIDQLAGSLDRLSARVNAQQQQSRSYQQTLMQHRLRAALRHVLDDGVRRSRRGAEAEPIASPAFAAERRSDVVMAGSKRLLWLMRDDLTDLARAMARARTARLGRRLLARLPVPVALSQLLQAELDLLACAELNAQGELVVATRKPLELEFENAEGHRSTRLVANGETLQLAVGEVVIWGGEWRVGRLRPIDNDASGGLA